MVAQQDAHDRDTPTREADREPRITVTEIPDSIYGNVIEAYSHHGFDRGYQVAVTEAIASLLPATEAFLREQPAVTPEARDLFYRFERFLARRLDVTTRANHWVEGGAGI